MAEQAGFDLSNNQPAPIDWPSVANAGFVFGWHKISEGAGYIDPYVDGRRARRIDDGEAAGVRMGGYHFARPGDPEQQAHLFLAKLPPGATVRPVLDAEVAGITPEFCDRFLGEVAGDGHRPILYTYSAFAAANYRGSDLNRWDLWLANYRATPPAPPGPWSEYVCWQHTSSGAVPGAPGVGDLNITNDLGRLLATHPAPSQEDDMPFMVRFDNDPKVYVVTALGHKHVKSEAERDRLKLFGLVKTDPTWENGCVQVHPEHERADILFGDDLSTS